MTQIDLIESTGMVRITIIDRYGVAWEDEIPAEDYFPDWEQIGTITQGAA